MDALSFTLYERIVDIPSGSNVVTDENDNIVGDLSGLAVHSLCLSYGGDVEGGAATPGVVNTVKVGFFFSKDEIEADSRLKDPAHWNDVCEEWNRAECSRVLAELRRWQQRHAIAELGSHVQRHTTFLGTVVCSFLDWYDANHVTYPSELAIAQPEVVGAAHQIVRPLGTRRRMLSRIEREELYPRIVGDLQDAYDEGDLSSGDVFQQVSNDSVNRYGMSFSPDSLRGIFERNGGKFTTR